MGTKYKLFDTPEAFEAKNSELMSHLGIPNNSGTSNYASISSVENPDSPDYGMYIFPVEMTGPWKCDQYFDASELVDFDSSWFVAEEIL
jgi:hypothetical protein